MDTLTEQLAGALRSRIDRNGGLTTSEESEALASFDAARDALDTHSKTCASRSQLLTDPPKSRACDCKDAPDARDAEIAELKKQVDELKRKSAANSKENEELCDQLNEIGDALQMPEEHDNIVLAAKIAMRKAAPPNLQPLHDLVAKWTEKVADDHYWRVSSPFAKEVVSDLKEAIAKIQSAGEDRS